MTYRLQSVIKVHLGGTPGSNLEAGPKAESMDECCFLACSAWLAQQGF